MKDRGASTPNFAVRCQTKEARGRLRGAKRTLAHIDSSRTLVVHKPLANMCTTVAIFVDHVAIFADSIR